MNAAGDALSASPGPPASGSPAEGPPVAHDHDKPVSLDPPERGDNGTARYAVVLGELRNRRQPVVCLPFARIDPFAKRGLNAPARRFRRAVRWHPPMIANTV